MTAISAVPLQRLLTDRAVSKPPKPAPTIKILFFTFSPMALVRILPDNLPLSTFSRVCLMNNHGAADIIGTCGFTTNLKCWVAGEVWFGVKRKVNEARSRQVVEEE